MRTVSLITLSILICACSANKKNLPDGIEIIPVEVDKVSQDASSFLEKMKGQGPEDYVMVLDINFNPYLKGIDLLNPYGTIYTYSPTFELLAKRKFKPEFPLEYLMALDAENYI